MLHHLCRMVVIPDMLKNSPMFKRIDPKNKVRPAPLSACNFQYAPASHCVSVADEECANGCWRQRQGSCRTGKGKGSSRARQGAIGMQ